MLRTCLAIGALTVMCCVTIAADEQAVLLKVYQDQVGDRWENTKTAADKVTVTVHVGGMSRTVSQKNVLQSVAYTCELLKKSGDQATRFTRQYTRAVRSENSKKRRLPYHTLKVLFEHKDGKYHFTTNGEKLSDDEAADFEKEFNSEDDDIPENQEFLPNYPVKPGDSWTSDPRQVLKKTRKIGPMLLDKMKSKFSGKLLRTYRKDGALFGVIQLDQVIAIKSVEIDGNVLPAAEKCAIRIAYEVNTCIDGSTKSDAAKVTTQFDLEFTLPNGSLRMVGHTAGTESEVLLPTGK